MDPIGEILETSRTIAVVGLSDKLQRPSHEVAKYLQENGYRIIPINPNVTQVLGEKAFPDLLAVTEPIDVVNIFRDPGAVPEIIEQAIAKGVKVVWMQPGAENYDAAERAHAAGLKVIVGMCMRVKHRQKLPT